MTYSFDVFGVPQQKGSSRAFRVGRRIVVTSANPNLKPWEHGVRYWAERAAATGGGLLPPPVALRVEFRMPAPKKVEQQQQKQPGDVLHAKPPDLDKLIRGLCDPMSGVLYLDDRHISEIAARKRYVRPGESPGATVHLSTLRG